VTEGVEVQRGLKFSVVVSMICGRELVARLEGSGAGEPKCFILFNTNKVASIREHYYKAPEKISCSEVLDRAPNFTSSSQELQREVRIRSVVVG